MTEKIEPAAKTLSALNFKEILLMHYLNQHKLNQVK